MKEYKYKIKGVDYSVKINGVEDNIAKVEVNGVEFDVEMEKPIAQPKPVVRAVAAPVKTVEAPKAAQEAVAQGVTAVKAPLPGTVNDIKVTVGQAVKKGQTVVVLEAMKMENNIDAERDGKIAEVRVAKGDTVMEGAVLVTIE
ncbi:MAG: biotin/lipoyl-binding protein [Bacteroidaceae bacterium]|jgi:biotin carboxyl carrier protein|nr:biotin/lipoyl-binding protein [Bacteroidaceae bacterium]MBO7556873.1 biotin/lipoyl-binding protein [Bacteroidaceae bacterium]MBQ2182762.1 biotin/lipoyl-binding protein [Bacteroidaceae bacterium]MBQ2199341.1 biotin/lipoyl-binding protein [Bacteroidaceae bacterium]MBQ2340146.1 biotin/lipoyl-binding protein [Bacteroidaceae bacterium]